MPPANELGQQVGDEVPGWSRREPAVAVTLQGRYVRVEPLSVTHAEALHAELCDEGSRHLWTYRPTDPPPDVARMQGLIGAHLDAPDLETMAIVPAGGQPAGIASYTRIEPAHGQVEVAGVLYSRTLQRTRAATEAIHLMARHAFETLGYRRFEWKCDSLNEPSKRAAERLGFTYEGRFRSHMVTKSRNRDTDWFSITDTEWPRVRAAHERWLDPDNFDQSGQQRRSLADLTRPA